MRAYYATKISDHLSRTPEGFLVCQSVPIARTGVQQYNGSEIGLGDGVVDVYRSPEEVFASACLASFESKPVTDGHPPEWVKPENVGAYSRGHVRDLRKGEAMEDGDLPLIADLIIMDAVLIDKVINSNLREISCGYDCEYIPVGDGKYEQKMIRGNHIAVVKDGRAGDRVRIQDEKKEATKVTKNNVLKHIFGLGWKQFTKDAEPEAVQEALEAVKESEPEEKSKDANEFVEKKKEEEKEKPQLDDKHVKLIDALKDCKDEDSMRQAFDTWVQKSKDEDPSSEKLDRIISLLEQVLGGEQAEAEAEEAEDAELIPVEILKGEELPINPIPGADEIPEELKEKAEEKKEEKAKDAAIHAFMRTIKPIVAQSRDKALIRAFNEIVRKPGKASDGGYGKLLRLTKPEVVKDAETHMQRKVIDQAKLDTEYGKNMTSQFLGKHPAQAMEDLKNKGGK